MRIDATSASPKGDADVRRDAPIGHESARPPSRTPRGDVPAAVDHRDVFRTFKQLLGCGHLFSDKHNGVEIQAYCAMIVCMLILIYTGEKPNRAMDQMVWYYLIGLASLKELQAFITSRR